MKTTILLFALILGYITPTFAQLNLHRKSDATTEQFPNKKNDYFNYKFVDKFSGSLSNSPHNSFAIPPIMTAPKFTKEIYSGDDMPCLKPKGNYIPCLKPDDIFSMRVYKPESIIWGTLWAFDPEFRP